jgi:streptomycin 6-kinase
VALLEHDRDAWAVLLERCEPGSSLLAARLGETETADVVARVLGELWTAPIDGPFSDVGEEMTRQAERLPDLAAHWPATVAPDLVNRALRHLEAGPDTSRRVLLHRDLHGENILLSARGWLAIDPKPWVGEPACDLAAAIVSGAPADVEGLAQRLELGADRVREHAIALAVVLALWSRSVGRDGGAIRLAERAAVLAEN